MAAGLLGIALLVTENAVSRIKAASGGFLNLHKLDLPQLQELLFVPEPFQVREVLTDPDVRVAMRQLGGIRKHLEALPTFGKHYQAVNQFFSAVENQEKPGPNLLSNWKE
jgi:hypothetical protein